MPSVTFYRQLRMDGGMRTGIDVDGDSVYSRYKEGATDADPRLRWFVDLRCEGENLANSPRSVRKWLLDNSIPIGEAFERFAQEIESGIDPDVYMSSWEDFPQSPGGVRMKIVVSAIQRVDAREMASVVRDIASHWEENVRELKPVQNAGSR